MMITGPAIAHAEIARLIGGLCIEIKTGLKVGRGHSVMLVANQWSGSAKRTKKGALEDLVIWYYGQGGEINAQWGSVTRALGDYRAALLRRKAQKAGLEYVAKSVEKAQEEK